MIRKTILSIFIFMLAALFTGCGRENSDQSSAAQNYESGYGSAKMEDDTGSVMEQEIMDGTDTETIVLSSEVMQLENGLSAVEYRGNDGFDAFISQGGASSDEEVVAFLAGELFSGEKEISFGGMPFGCSTLSVKDGQGNWLFGRNFDWDSCNGMIVSSLPENGYASISTVNTDFIRMSGLKLSDLPDAVQAMICLYAPLDGMNEKGLAVSVNMIQDTATISQNTDKPDITTTTAIRLLLNQAADVGEAMELLKQYDMHASMGYMMHLALADRSGRSVAVEYIDNEMVVIDTPVVTNFYLAEGEKNGIGTSQSHERYDILMQALADGNAMSMEDVGKALDSVSKDNFGEFESTEWSIVFNQVTGEVHYYHRENYGKKYIFRIG